MIRIKRIRMIYDRIPLDRREATLLSQQLLSLVKKELQGAPSGTLDHISLPPIRISSDRVGPPEIARRAATAVGREVAQRLNRKSE